MSFTFGPEWARDTGCCAKPIGCTSTSPACLMRGHPWKRRHAMATDDPMRQEAPYPRALAYLVERLEYRPGWTFDLLDKDRGQGSKGLTLIITTCGYDSYHPERGENYRVHHYMPVPPAAYNPGSWQRWLFDQILEVERHEAMEFFTIHDSPGSEHAVKPYAPNHGNGEDPYIVHDLTTGEARRTSFRNVLDDDGTGRSKS